MDCIDNCLEFITGAKTATVTFSQTRLVNRIKKLAKERPDECTDLIENAEGSVVAHVPVTWFKLRPPKETRKLTEEENNKLRERLELARQAREKKRLNE